eukprot:3591110-Pleurochrysis_carterae.AAC.6
MPLVQPADWVEAARGAQRVYVLLADVAPRVEAARGGERRRVSRAHAVGQQLVERVAELRCLQIARAYGGRERQQAHLRRAKCVPHTFKSGLISRSHSV